MYFAGGCYAYFYEEMSTNSERNLSETNVKRLKDQLNIERNEWPSKREQYIICGKLGEGATGNVSRIGRYF